MQDSFMIFRASPSGTFVADAEPPKFSGVVAIRTEDQILLYDPTSGAQWEFQLPDNFPNESLTIHWLKPESLLLQHSAGQWSGGNIEKLTWITPSGTIEREELAELQGYLPLPERHRFWGLCAMMPEPIGWLGAIFGVEPFWRLQYYKAGNYSEALRQTVELCWPMIVVVLLVSLVAAWFATRLHRRYRRPRMGVWAAFVFLLGVPGLIAYWLEHRAAALEQCRECDAIVPRDRDACANCATPFPAPPLVGTEIFA
jgi:hypothetical protein